jgi:TatD DNase family protein
LDFDQFDADREAVLERAARAGVERILIPGLTLTSSRSAVKLTENHPMLYAAIGVHPTEASKVESQTSDFRCSIFEEFRGLAQNPKVKAVGEIGLDYYWDAAPHDLQQRILREQLDLAIELELPVVIHFREKGDATDGPCASDLMRVLEEWVNRLGRGKSSLEERPGVLHSFSGSREMAQRAIGLNFYIGVTGPVTYRKDRQELIASLPLARLLIETDAPFLAPSLHRGKRNEPAFVALIADKIAALHSCNLEQAAAVTSANALRLFGWKD